MAYTRGLHGSGIGGERLDTDESRRVGYNGVGMSGCASLATSVASCCLAASCKASRSSSSQYIFFFFFFFFSCFFARLSSSYAFHLVTSRCLLSSHTFLEDAGLGRRGGGFPRARISERKQKKHKKCTFFCPDKKNQKVTSLSIEMREWLTHLPSFPSRLCQSHRRVSPEYLLLVVVLVVVC